MKSFLSVFLLLFLLSGCSSDEEKTSSETSLAASVSSQRSHAKQSDKTFFSLSEESPFFLKEGEKEEITIQFTPVHRPVSSVEALLYYDSEKLSITEIKKASGVIPFLQEIDTEKGEIHFVAAVDQSLFGENLPLFSFQVTPKKGAPKGETILRFDPASLHALLPDVNNTDTAVTENLPKIVFSL